MSSTMLSSIVYSTPLKDSHDLAFRKTMITILIMFYFPYDFQLKLRNMTAPEIFGDIICPPHLWSSSFSVYNSKYTETFQQIEMTGRVVGVQK